MNLVRSSQCRDQCSFESRKHKKFIEAIVKYGNNWLQVEKYIKTRTSTQARSHAQKFLIKLKENKNIDLERIIRPLNDFTNFEYVDLKTGSIY